MGKNGTMCNSKANDNAEVTYFVILL